MDADASILIIKVDNEKQQVLDKIAVIAVVVAVRRFAAEASSSGFVWGQSRWRSAAMAGDRRC